ncbi:MAG: sulfurtransferase TusA family protein [Desulfobacteraceae bacterium]|nr:MAG: sulfurtransferase TusA family protein [Desulfobacteraceae bacterium]
MSNKAELDLAGVGWPVCLLECKRTLKSMQAGDILEIALQDPDALDELVTIVTRSPDRILAIDPEQGGYRIRIRKG